MGARFLFPRRLECTICIDSQTRDGDEDGGVACDGRGLEGWDEGFCALEVALAHPLPLLQECDTIEGGKIYFEDFLRIVTEENRSVVQTLAVRATCIDTCREPPPPPSPAVKPAA